MADIDHHDLYQEIKRILEQARSQSYQAINMTMVQAYWQIGRVIVEEEQRGKVQADYGTALITTLARKLAQDFGKGGNETNSPGIKLDSLSSPVSQGFLSEQGA